MQGACMEIQKNPFPGSLRGKDDQLLEESSDGCDFFEKPGAVLSKAVAVRVVCSDQLSVLDLGSNPDAVACPVYFDGAAHDHFFDPVAKLRLGISDRISDQMGEASGGKEVESLSVDGDGSVRHSFDVVWCVWSAGGACCH